MPALDLYPGYTSLRHDSITWSVAAPTCVTSGSRSSESIESRSPWTAFVGLPSGPCSMGRE
jgi:hypothetical protein